MVYGYIRVSTDKQIADNKRFEIANFAKEKAIEIEIWIEETVSGTKRIDERKFGALLKKISKDDILIVTELSRLGRNSMQIMSILHTCMEREAKVYTVKEHYELGDNLSSKILAFAFGLSAEIERNLISQCTKEALARKKAEGVVLGRPKGRKSKTYKLTGKGNDIKFLLNKKNSKSCIAKKLGVHRLTVTDFIKTNNLNA